MAETLKTPVPQSDISRETEHARAQARRDAIEIFRHGVAAADPFEAVVHGLRDLKAEGTHFYRPTVIAVGKAAGRMTEAVMSELSPKLAFVLTNYENHRAIEGAECRAAAHPVPDFEGARAALRIEEILANATGDILTLISGGGSALMPAPCAGISLDEKICVNELLLQSGADIEKMNLVRQQLSRLKGGGFLRAAHPARVTTLILSDVIGDDLRAIASGPTASPIGTRTEAAQLLKDYGVWDKTPENVRQHLSQEDNAPSDLPKGENFLVGSNGHSVNAMAQASENAVRIDEPLVGDVAEAAQKVIAQSTANRITLFGGETTVKVKGAGKGGRNQELALRVALEAQKHGIENFVFLSGGTDGRDGPTDAAGGVVDGQTLARLAQSGLSVEDVLGQNDSYTALKATGDLLEIGATGTNVADLQVMIRF